MGKARTYRIAGSMPSSDVTHFVPVTLCITQKARVNLRLDGVKHNVTGTKCVTRATIRLVCMTPNAPATKGVIGCHIGCSGVAESLVEQSFLRTEGSDWGLLLLQDHR